MDSAAPGRGGLAMRLCASTWILLLAVIAMRNWPDGRTDGWPAVLSHGALVLVYCTLWLMVLRRPAPVGRADGIMPGAIAFAGSYMPWLIGLMPRHALGDAAHLAVSVLILSGSVLTLVTALYLGRSFSVVPQARRLVTAGPYILIRHPLYFAEELMIVGAALLYLSPLTVALLLLHFTLQVRRMFYEEAVLGRAFPEYRSYKRRTWRLLPYVW